jgi:hypothetical protein
MASVYCDRKMMKWLPFQTLNDQSETIYDLERQLLKITKPSLSDDQYAYLNMRFQEAFLAKEPVVITYFKKGFKQKHAGTILGFDYYLRLVYIEEKVLELDSILDIT